MWPTAISWVKRSALMDRISSRTLPPAERIPRSAFSPSDFSVFGESTGTFTTFGQTVVVNVTVPIGVIKGVVSYTDGTGVPFPDVFVTQTNADGNLRSFFANRRSSDGSYLIVGPVVGDFTLTVQDFNSGLNPAPLEQ